MPHFHYHTCLSWLFASNYHTDLSYVQPEGNYYFKTSDSYQILNLVLLIFRTVLNLQVLVTLLHALLLAK